MSTTEQTTKKNFTNYKVFGFWLAKSFKDQGIIDQDGHDAWIKAQEIHGAKEAQEEFYGKFFESISAITQELKDLTKATKSANKDNDKQAKKDAAKAAKLAEKEAAKAEKLAEDIARFPQSCMLADRKSTLTQHGLSLRDAMRNEWRGSKFEVTKGVKGAGRFVGGKGRGGDFSEI